MAKTLRTLSDPDFTTKGNTLTFEEGDQNFIDIWNEAKAAVDNLGDLGITATAAELNILDGATLSTAELNLLDGLTATTAELNQLDGNAFTSGITGTSADFSGALDADTLRPDTGKFLAPTSYQFRNAGDTGFRDVQMASLTATQATLSNLTSGRVLLAGASGLVEDDAGLTFDGSVLDVVADIHIDSGGGTDQVTIGDTNDGYTVFGTFHAGTGSGRMVFDTYGQGPEYRFNIDDVTKLTIGDSVTTLTGTLKGVDADFSSTGKFGGLLKTENRLEIDTVGSDARLFFMDDGTLRWNLFRDDSQSSDLRLARYDETGSFLDVPLTFSENTGDLIFTHNLETDNFSSGSTGWQVSYAGDGEWNDGYYRGDLQIDGGLYAAEFIVEQTRVMTDFRMSVGGGRVKSVSGSAGTETVTLEDDFNNANPFAAGDIVLIQQRTGAFSGTIIKKIYREVASISGLDVTFQTTNITWTAGDANDDTGSIAAGDDISVVGATSASASQATRDHYIHYDIAGVAIPAIRFFDGVDDVDPPTSDEIMRVGGLDPGGSNEFSSSLSGDIGVAGKISGNLAFAVTDSEGLIGGWSFDDGKLYKGTDIVFDSSVPKISLNSGDVVLNATAGLDFAGGSSFSSTRAITWAGGGSSGSYLQSINDVLNVSGANGVNLNVGGSQKITLNSTTLDVGVDIDAVGNDITGSDVSFAAGDFSGRVAVTDNILSSQRITAGATSTNLPDEAMFHLTDQTYDGFWSVQDGNGRLQLKWNASHGTSETFLASGGEPAFFWDLAINTDPVWEMKYNGSGGSVGASISWDTLLSLGTGGIESVNYKSEIISVTNDGFEKIGDVRNSSGYVFISANNALNFQGIALCESSGASESIRAVDAGANFDVDTGTPNGTAGTDGNVTVFINGSGEVHIENRSNATIDFTCTLI